jgi:ribulose-5-phosphate 4-epimerase/fuculose-1-phosphate aldolase
VRASSAQPERRRGGAQKGGVLPISQQSIFVLSSLGYHNYEGVALNEAEKPRLVADLGDRNFLMLRNHGLLTAAPPFPTRSS